ncbi:transposase [Embleya sp. NPDC050493]|uniref:transposase n=1 Tax=Embleya sp. NPDC050493 TaxID=3363989 RepID=UPI0037872B98
MRWSSRSTRRRRSRPWTGPSRCCRWPPRLTEKRTADYVRHGTTNLFAALNVTTGGALGECKPTRNGKDFLAFLKKAVKPHAGKDIHVVLDNLSTHTTPEVREWPAKNLQVQPPTRSSRRSVSSRPT